MTSKLLASAAALAITAASAQAELTFTPAKALLAGTATTHGRKAPLT